VNAGARLAAFGVSLVAALGVGAGIGAIAGPSPAPTEDEAPAPLGEGVVAAFDGYRLVPATAELDPDGGTFEFRLEDPDGRPVLDVEPTHERDLHLIVVARDLSVFRHVHPELTTDGTWLVDLDALPAGSYRAIADVMIADGPRLALGTDLAVAGPLTPQPLADPSPTTTVDGYEVSLATERGDGGEVTATLVVRKEGTVVELEPYLGAKGHLVALRAGDLAYAHVHPIEHRSHAPERSVSFDATLPVAGRYGLFFDFKHDGEVHTASFTFDQGTVRGAAPMEH